MNKRCKATGFRWGESIEIPSTRSGDVKSHVVGARYPCRSVAAIPRLILERMEKPLDRQIHVLDPFMGSGTTALEACLAGFQPFGVEVDPYARLISDASVAHLSPKSLARLEDLRDSLRVRFDREPVDQALLPDIERLDYWFTERNIRDLLKLKRLLLAFCKSAPELYLIVFAAFADIIRAASNAERQSLKPYISTRFQKTPGDVFELFQKAITRYIEGLKGSHAVNGHSLGGIHWLDGDATRFTSSVHMDVAITSPPYINAMDYVRCIKFESAWVGIGSSQLFNELRGQQLGEAARGRNRIITQEVANVIEPWQNQLDPLDPARARIVAAYFEDMYQNMLCTIKILRPKGNYHVIIGNSIIRGIAIPTHEILAHLGEVAGFRWNGYFNYRIRDHRTSLPRKGNGGKIEVEHVITMEAP